MILTDSLFQGKKEEGCLQSLEGCVQIEVESLAKYTGALEELLLAKRTRTVILAIPYMLREVCRE